MPCVGPRGITARGDGGAQILFQAMGLERQPVLGIPVPNGRTGPTTQAGPPLSQQKCHPC